MGELHTIGEARAKRFNDMYPEGWRMHEYREYLADKKVFLDELLKVDSRNQEEADEQRRQCDAEIASLPVQDREKVIEIVERTNAEMRRREEIINNTNNGREY